MSTFVLVHGSHQGGWIWKSVAERLLDDGHRVYRPTLLGSAERKRQLRADLTLDDYGQELADLLFYEDLSNTVLVGTSIGGMVVCRAAELAPERVGQLVFIDALVPLPGESVPEINSRAQYDLSKVVYGLPPEQALPGAVFPDLPPEMQEWASARYTQQAIRPTDEAVDLQAFWSMTWPKVDVLRCARSPLPPQAHQKRTAERLNGTYAEIDAGHYAMLSHGAQIADYLLERTSAR
jgi:pimeloyl-ACP methyl ester carboxylesterase